MAEEPITSPATPAAPPDQLSITDFAAKIKQRDPRLTQVPDEELARKVFERRPDLMKFVKTAEARPDRHHKPDTPQATTSDEPGALKRFGQAVGAPTTMEEVKAGTPTTTGGKVAEGVAVATGAVPAIQAGKAVFNYGKTLYDKAANLYGTAKSSYEDVQSGKKTPEQGMTAVDDAATDTILRGFASIAGGDALANGLTDLKSKNYWGLAGDMVGFATLMTMLKGGKTETAGTGEAKAMVRRSERLANIIGETTGADDRISIVNQGEPLVRQAMQEKGFDDIATDPGIRGKKGKFPSREGKPEAEFDAQGKPTGKYVSNVRMGARRVLEVLDHAVDISNRPFDKIIGEYGSEAVPDTVKQPVVKTLKQLAGEYSRVGDSGLSNALNGIADNVASTRTVEEMNAIKVHANKEMQNLRAQMTPGAAIGASVQTAYAYKLAAEAIRTSLYPMLEELSGVNLAKFGAREHAAIAFRDGAYSSYFRWIDAKQASEAARGYWGGVIHGSKYTRHILERILRIEPSPAGGFTRDFRKGLGKIGVGSTGETLTTIGKNQKQLGGSTAPTRFKISSGIPQEIVTGGSGADPAMSYAGQQEVQNPEHTPMQGSARYPQRQQLGTTEGTIPERVFNRNEPRMREQDAIGSSGTSTPERSFTGAPTKTESRWQYLTSAKGPTQEVAITGPGALETTSVEVAARTYSKLKSIAESQEFMRYPFKTRELIRDEIASLDKQLRDYFAYSGKKAPRGVTVTPAKPGFIRPSVKGQATAIGLQTQKQADQQDAQP
jgi:hypothetical protein